VRPHPPLLFRITSSAIKRRDVGTDICLHCPLADPPCLKVRQPRKRPPGVGPDCLLDYARWRRVPIGQAEHMAIVLLRSYGQEYGVGTIPLKPYYRSIDALALRKKVMK
jgi:hypothetical protein